MKQWGDLSKQTETICLDRTTRRNAMRGFLIALLAAAAIGLAGTSPTVAVPANGVVINDAANAARLVEDVHCRPYRHWHRWGYGYGCRYGYRSYYWRGHRHGYWRGHHHRGLRVHHHGFRGGHHRGGHRHGGRRH
jgi:hypothetical protein